GGQAEDGLELAGADVLLADDGLGIAPEEDAVRENAVAFARALQGADDVQQVGVIALLLWRHAPGEALESVAAAALAQGEAGGPRLVGEWRIGNDVIVGAELLAVLEFGIEERVSREHVGRREIVQE